MQRSRLYHFSILLVLGLFLVLNPSTVEAQSTGELTIRLVKEFGYASGAGTIQGTFKIKASGPETLGRVSFFIDDQLIGEVTQEPFELRFSTGKYPLGNHRIYAVGITLDGLEINSNEIRAEFISAEETFQETGEIIMPLLVVISLAMLFSFGASLVSSRKLSQLPPGTPRKYGAAGGAICPKCQRPFSRSFFSLNLLFGKLERCPFCGKVSILKARSLDDLRAAEEAERLDAQNGLVHSPDAQEKLRQDLDQSRYQDL